MSTTYPLRVLPEQWFYTHGITGNEVSFKPQNQLREVLAQGNGVYLVLDLPHLVTKVIIAFPTQGGGAGVLGSVVPEQYAGSGGRCTLAKANTKAGPLPFRHALNPVPLWRVPTTRISR